jgi:CheY-like chemotaxis protein
LRPAFQLVLRKLRRLEEARHIPIIIITGGEPEKYEERALAAGAISFFHKPIEHEELLAVIHQTLGDQVTAAPMSA